MSKVDELQAEIERLNERIDELKKRKTNSDNAWAMTYREKDNELKQAKSKIGEMRMIAFQAYQNSLSEYDRQQFKRDRKSVV